MDDKDPIEQKFKSAFDGFAPEPPAEAWDRLQAVMHPPAAPKGLLARFLAMILAGDKPVGFYLAIAGISLGLFSGIYYFGFSGRYTIRGHAYTGETRLKGGVATLFAVADRCMPWDSLEYSRSDNVDESGHFSFSRIRAGHYLLRIAPANDQSNGCSCQPTWYDGSESSDSARILNVENQDLNIEILLLKKP